MARKKSTESTEKKERASVGRERRLALALAAMRDAADDNAVIPEAAKSADELLNQLGYQGLVSIPKRVAVLEAELATALESKNYTRVSELGLELEKARLGKSSTVVTPE